MIWQKLTSRSGDLPAVQIFENRVDQMKAGKSRIVEISKKSKDYLFRYTFREYSRGIVVVREIPNKEMEK